MKAHLTLKNIRRAVQTMKKMNVEPVNGSYVGRMSLRSLVDVLLTYKRPRSTKLYRSLS